VVVITLITYNTLIHILQVIQGLTEY